MTRNCPGVRLPDRYEPVAALSGAGLQRICRRELCTFSQMAGFRGTLPRGRRTSFDQYVSDPNQPVPYVSYPATDVPQEYMVSDQRFASHRPDVLVYHTEPLAWM